MFNNLWKIKPCITKMKIYVIACIAYIETLFCLFCFVFFLKKNRSRRQLELQDFPLYYNLFTPSILFDIRILNNRIASRITKLQTHQDSAIYLFTDHFF